MSKVIERACKDPRNTQWSNYGRSTEGSWWVYRRLPVGHGLYSVQAISVRDHRVRWFHRHFERCEIEP